MGSSGARFVLGTANFGLNYGVANRSGQLKDEDIERILASAQSGGMNTLDTAVAYGDSEATLGRCDLHGWSAITKLPAIPGDCSDIGRWMRARVDSSLVKLGLDSLYALLLHRPAQLLERVGAELYRSLYEQKARGVTARIGISIYDSDELDRLPPEMVFDVVQVPFNIVDCRLSGSGWLRRLHARGIEIHARSVFLQGLLLMGRDRRPLKFRKWGNLWETYDRWLADTGITPLQACLRYVVSHPEIDKILVGVDSAAQLSGILAAAEGELPPIPESFGSTDVDLLNPSRWGHE